jgi:hypothetical protein
MKSHMGIFMSIGKAGTYNSSCKQKLNTKISTVAELVALDDVMAQILWTRHFLAAQGLQNFSKENNVEIIDGQEGDR